jgi:hypothetical protein
MHRAIILLCGLAMTVSAFGQQAQDVVAPYQVPAPEGWGKETIQLPPDFASDMTWQGTEELRFAPNFMKADSATFFSYALLFWLPDSCKVDTATLETELLVYYQGLAKAVSVGKEQVIDVTTFTMTVQESATKPNRRAGGEDVIALDGELKWIEPFTTGKSQILHMEIHVWHASKHRNRCVFICASPQPQTAAVWKSLREIREGCVLHNSTPPRSETKP